MGRWNRNLLIVLLATITTIPALAASEVKYFTSSETKVSLLPQITQSPDSTPEKYAELRDLLAGEKWREADEETYNLILQLGRRDREAGLDTRSIERISCSDLQTIDGLWVKHSAGNFGFSVQSSIYLETGNQLEAYQPDAYKSYGNLVGWREAGRWRDYNKMLFSLDTPKGHLPVGIRAPEAGTFRESAPEFIITQRARRLLFSKLADCQS